MISVQDAVGRCVALSVPARRIVSLVPSLTETVCILGAAEQLVGVTRYCTEPSAVLARLPRVGGTKNPDIARIHRLEPDLVLMNAEENRREDFVALETAGLRVFVSFPRRVADVPALLQQLGMLTGTAAAADDMIADLQRARAEIAATECPAVRVFCPIWKNPWMSFNRDTYPHDLLAHVGAINVCAECAERFCRIELAAVAAAMPEIVVLPDEPYVFSQKDVPSLAALSATPALRQGRIVFVDGKALTWYGARTASGLRDLHRIIA